MQLARKKDQHNCLTWALDEWEKTDGYLVIRWCRSSRHKWLRWPHFLILDKDHHEKLRHFLPDDTAKIDTKLFPDIWFDGAEKQGDDPETTEEN
jgi:hypothetical protein